MKQENLHPAGYEDNAITYRNDPTYLCRIGHAVHEGQTATALIKGGEYTMSFKIGFPVREYSVAPMALDIWR